MCFPSIQHIVETDSTNQWLREHATEQDAVVWADYQTAGRGCGTNRWESEHGRNLLFSVLTHPQAIAASRQFLLSMAISLAICDALARYIEEVSIKWPNDIYWRDRKLCGILIEHRLSGADVRESIIGVGLNVNQTVFRSDAPNPVSLAQVLGRETDRRTLLSEILDAFAQRLTSLTQGVEACWNMHVEYEASLYRRNGWYLYQDAAGTFEAAIEHVEDSGMLVLRDRGGRLRRYAFKEVQFVV